MRSRVVRTAVLLGLLVAAGSIALAQSPPPPQEPAATSPETIELPAGGVVLVPDERLAVDSEDIQLGRAGVRNTLVVRNTSSEAFSRIISWAMPEIDKNSIGDDVVVLAGADARNFANAAVTVDGVPVQTGIEQRASAFGRDITSVLETAGVPLNPLAPGAEEALRRVPAEQATDLEERGAVHHEDDRLLPNWAVKTTMFWRQTFEPGKSITIGLVYAPVTASGVWTSQSLAQLKETYCIDRATEQALAARLSKPGRAPVAHRLTYAMTGAAGWWTSVPRLKLAVEKPSLEAIVATCWKDLKPAGPTLLEAVRADFKPGEDIRVLLVN